MTGTVDMPDMPGRDLSDGRPPGDRDSVVVVRSEQQLQVGTELRVSGRAVLRRYVVTETITETFQVRREEVRVDYEAVTDEARSEPQPNDENLAATGSAFDDRIVEMVLHREVPVTHLKVVAAERVRLHVDTVTDQVPVSADIQKERLDLARDPDGRG